MKSFEITSDSANQRLDKFLIKNLPELPRSLMYKYVRTKRIKVNKKRAEISTRLFEGDVVDLYINDEFLKKPDVFYDFLNAPAEPEIIFEDENILVLNKRPGLLSHPSEGEYTDTLISAVQRYLYEKGEYAPESEQIFSPTLVNRIDRNTGGIVIAAKNAESLRVLNKKLSDRELQKFYLCVCYGALPKNEDLLRGYLIKDKKTNRVTVFEKEVSGSKEIRTHYKVLASEELKSGTDIAFVSLLEVELLTGRTHQIRAHLSSLGCPIVGDAKYGFKEKDRVFGYKKQMLCSYKINFDFTTDAGVLGYLSGREFSVPVEKIWFLKDFPEFQVKEI